MNRLVAFVLLRGLFTLLVVC